MNIWHSFCMNKPRIKLKRRIAPLVLSVILIILILISISVGSSSVSLWEAVRSLFKGEWKSTQFKIVFLIRLPRIIGAILAGGALAVSGIIIQAVLNNPMASPSIIGVNSGAGFFVILAMAIFPSTLEVLPIVAFAGSLLASLLIYAVSMSTGAGTVTITLIGIAVGSILNAGINTVKALFPNSVYDISGFLIGGLSLVSFGDILPASVIIVPCLIVAFVLCRSLDILSLGQEMAQGLGMNVKRSRITWLMLASALAGSAVSYVGLIGFVGLIVPHIMRRIVGSSHKHLILSSIIGAGVLLLGADLLSRVLFAPYELPAGIILSLVGGPFFVFLVINGRKSK